MKVLVRHLETWRYFGILSEWTRDQADAVDFGSTIEALIFCRDFKISNVEFVLSFDDGEADLHMAVDRVLSEEMPVWV